MLIVEQATEDAAEAADSTTCMSTGGKLAMLKGETGLVYDLVAPTD